MLVSRGPAWCLILAGGALAVGPDLCLAIEQTCSGCIDACCEWSVAGVTEFPYDEFVRLNTKTPPPCVEVSQQHGIDSREFGNCQIAAYNRCLERNCSRCVYSYIQGIPTPVNLFKRKLPGHVGVSGTKPVRLTVGEVTVVEPARERERKDAHGLVSRHESLRTVD